MGFMDFVKGVAPFVPVVGPAISAVAGLIGSRQTNAAQTAMFDSGQQFNAAEAAAARQFSAEQAEIARTWSAQEASRQMDFQREMSNTQYQRAMADMRSSGLNPILAYSQGGAGNVGGAMGTSVAATGASAQSPGPAQLRNPLEGFSHAAMQLAPLMASVDLTRSQIDKTDAERDYIRTQERIAESDFRHEDDQGAWRKPTTWSSYERQQRSELLYRQALHESWKEHLTEKQRDLVIEEIKNAQKENRRIEATTGNIEADTVLLKLRKSFGEAESGFWSAVGPAGYGAREGIKAAEGLVNSAARGLSLTPWGRSGQGLRLLHR